MPELTDPDDDGILEFTQTVEDVDGDYLSITGELDQINGNPQTGGDRNPDWFSFTTSSSLSGGTRTVDVNVEIEASELGEAGTTYTFELKADDGDTTSTCVFVLEIVNDNKLTKIDGKKMFWVSDYSSSNSNGEVRSGELSTAWDLSNVGSKGVQFELAVGAVDSIFVKPDGKKCYLTISDNDEIREYDVATAWDLSTMSLVQTNGSLGIDGVAPIFFHPDGDRMYVGSRDEFKNNFTGTSGALVEFGLSTPWDISTASVNYSVDISSNQEAPRSIFFRPNGENMYSVSAFNDLVSQYALSTPWDFQTAAHEKNSLLGKNYDAVWLKTDGQKIFLGVDNNSEVTGYNLATKWDIGSTSQASKEGVTGPNGLAFGVT
jgi:6-phosphogluconolactonase (cycloisomerase 2 family)